VAEITATDVNPRDRAGEWHSRLVTCCALIGIALGGCSAGEDSGAGKGDTLKVYVSVPLRGASGPQGRAIRDGAKLALDDAGGRAAEAKIDAVVRDDTGDRVAGVRWLSGVVAQNARGATSDTAAIAYVGELESGATRVSLPITNEARLLQVSPASTALDLVSPFSGSDEVPELVQPSGDRSFGRVIPDDVAQAAAGARWAKRLGARRALVYSSSRFSDTVAEEFAEEAEGLGVSVERPRSAAELRRAIKSNPDLLYVGGTAEAVLPSLRRVTRLSDATIMGTDTLLLDRTFLRRARSFESRLRLTAAAQDPAQLPPEGQRFVRRYRERYGRPPDPYAAYGYEAMAVVLDSIGRADPVDRGAVVDAFLETTDRRSVLGRYSIDEVGDTTLDRLSGYRVRDGRPVLDAALRVP
jgi:branched-chain amino acid transport system substrate-binding protein